MRYSVMLLLAVAFTGTSVGGTSVGDVAVRNRAVDVVLLDDGSRLLGVTMPSRQDDPKADRMVLLLMRTEWLKQNASELYKEARVEGADADAPDATTVQSLLEDHIAELQAAAEPSVQRIAFLTEELNALQFNAEDHDDSDITLLSIPARRVKQKVLKNAALRQLAGLGILNQIETTETISAVDLKKTLQQIAPGELVRDLPPDQPHQAEAVFQKLLVKTDQSIGKVCKLVFFNGTWLSEASGEQQQQAMMIQMMTGGLQSQLQQLLNETAGAPAGRNAKQNKLPDVLPPEAISIVEKESADVVEVRTMKLDLAAGTTSVGIAVYWKADDGQPWKKVQQVSATSNQSEVTAESRQRILQDKRVQEVTKLASGLGINSGQLDSALTMGAVVESASSKARQRLDQVSEFGSASTMLQVAKKMLP